ncbi:ParB N-terminal domain-containing protein [Staphylococcus aureus]|uniref:ParB N-terminal domain-containing protein n=1 Tax=Staphylococcus aureus TaxID=1280 RepID=UPI000451D235|nr:hypothetical protein V327_00584 [Staphylococcus aureus F29450_091412]
MNHIHEHLKLVPVDKIDLHETFEPLRLEKTKSSIEADDFIRHPILVTAMQHGRYMVIDGVHRYTSLKMTYKIICFNTTFRLFQS